MTSRSRYVSLWTEKELLDGELVDSLVVILKTKGCSWKKKEGCLMCGYHMDSDPSTRDEDVIDQVNATLEKLDCHKMIKIYTSGSFFDDDEISEKLRDDILESLEGRVEKLLVESRPEFISEEKVKKALRHVKNLEVAIGLESASDDVSKKCVNKGFIFEDFKKAATVLKGAGASVRTYLLIKPPFLTEMEAIEDASMSAERASEYSDVISFNPVNVQRRTPLERMWKRGEYRAPWLWSVLEVIDRSKDLDVRLVCGPSGGGTPRGAHNCGFCDKAILKALDEFSLDDRMDFDDIVCTCKEKWRDILELEGVLRSSSDAERIFND
jgi:radical SAM enzyme (TIGR01210 family)